MSLSLNWLFVSQLVSLVGTTLLTLSFLLSGRFRLVEDWFGGLDKVYRFHHLTGGISFVFLLHHPLFLAVNALPNTALSWKYLWFSELLPYNMGIISLYFMLLMIIFTLFIKLPYSLWKTTHELMGIALFFAVLHILTISSDVSRYLPLKMWMYFLLGMAIYSVIYRRFLYGYFGPKFNYLVKNIARKADILDVTLMPLIKKINYLPGQFVFIKFNDINKEVHPFSIAGCDEVGNLRIAVKILGDY
ncbi:MAG: Ferric reductase domain protein transmembrane component domain-containing protein, partial [Candidatus Collierbacteria bacterium GW2011_GWC2_43_12]